MNTEELCTGRIFLHYLVCWLGLWVYSIRDVKPWLIDLLYNNNKLLQITSNNFS